MMTKRILSMLVLLAAAVSGAWAQDPINLTPSADYKTWTLAQTPAYDMELQVEYDTELALAAEEDNPFPSTSPSLKVGR